MLGLKMNKNKYLNIIRLVLGSALDKLPSPICGKQSPTKSTEATCVDNWRSLANSHYETPWVLLSAPARIRTFAVRPQPREVRYLQDRRSRASGRSHVFLVNDPAAASRRVPAPSLLGQALLQSFAKKVIESAMFRVAQRLPASQSSCADLNSTCSYSRRPVHWPVAPRASIARTRMRTHILLPPSPFRPPRPRPAARVRRRISLRRHCRRSESSSWRRAAQCRACRSR